MSPFFVFLYVYDFEESYHKNDKLFLCKLIFALANKILKTSI